MPNRCYYNKTKVLHNRYLNKVNSLLLLVNVDREELYLLLMDEALLKSNQTIQKLCC